MGSTGVLRALQVVGRLQLQVWRGAWWEMRLQRREGPCTSGQRLGTVSCRPCVSSRAGSNMARFTFQIPTLVAPQVAVREEMEQGKQVDRVQGGSLNVTT